MKVKVVDLTKDRKATKELSKEKMYKTIEHLAVLRKGAIDTLELPADEVDSYIANTAQELFEKFDNMTDLQFTAFMMNDLIQNAPEEVVGAIFSKIGGDLDA
ncbi:MAG: hypothetical protein II656_05040 [Ruminococcus sp.]|nr:hypothetical protein [Ruminococcus sp.]